MNRQNRIEIIDKNGWRKTHPLPEKPILRIGSNAGNDIVLAGDVGGGVAPVHAQLVAAGSEYRLVNLADTNIRLGETGEPSLAARSTAVLSDGDQFMLGDFTLVFYGEGGFQPGAVRNNSEHMGLQLTLSQTALSPGQSVNGKVLVQNLSQETGIQFELELQGLEEQFYDLEPGPLLSSGGEKEVLLRLHHRGTRPLAGEHQLTLRATAPKNYPGEQVSVSQSIRVLPYYRHRAALLPPDGSGELPQPDEELTPPESSGPAPAMEQPAAIPTPPAWGTPEPQPDDAAPDSWWAAPAEVEPPPPTTAPPETAAEPASDDWWKAPDEAEPDTGAIPPKVEDRPPEPAPAEEITPTPEPPAEPETTLPAEQKTLPEAPPPEETVLPDEQEPAPAPPEEPQPAPEMEPAPPEPESKPPPPVRVEPAPPTTEEVAVDWWPVDEAEAEPKTKPSLPETAAPASDGTPAVDWWSDESEANAEIKPEPTETTSPPHDKTTGEDWWSAEPAADTPPVQLKADPTPASPSPETGTALPDWWDAAPEETGTETQETSGSETDSADDSAKKQST